LRVEAKQCYIPNGGGLRVVDEGLRVSRVEG
jgi:hypothetical protein